MNDKNKKSFLKMLRSNSLYLVLGLFFLGAGIAGFRFSDSKSPLSVSEITSRREENTTAEKKTQGNKAENSEIKINIDEFTTSVVEEPSTAAVFDNNSPKTEEEATELKDVSFSLPLNSGIGTDFSMGIPVFSPTMNDYRTHNGVDFYGIKGESVKTVAAGVVVSVEKNNLWGNMVTVEHAGGVTSTISGLADEALVAAGTNVYSDTVIGVVGEIPVEASENPHIHLEIRVNGNLTDPLEVLGFAENEQTE